MIGRWLLGALLAPAILINVSAEERSVYKSDFDQGVGRQHWSKTPSFATPKGDRLLGPFRTDESSTLSLKGLPAHSLVRLRCRVYMLDTVDGSQEKDQDSWSVGVVGGPCLLHTTFDNKWSKQRREVVDNDERGQAYPDEVSAARHPSRSGADVASALGLDGARDHEPVAMAVGYDLDLVFPHDKAELALRFGGMFMNGSSESWGLDDVDLTVFDAPAEADDGKLAAFWQDLHGADAEKANAALWGILAQGKAGVEFVLERDGEGDRDRARLARQRKERLAKDYKAAAADLGSDQFIERVEATQALIKMGPNIRPLIEEQLRGKVDAQVRVLLKSVLKKFTVAEAEEGAADLNQLARSRVKHLLRVADTPAARAALAAMIVADQEAGTAPELIELQAKDGRRKGAAWGFKLDEDRGCWTKWNMADNSVYWFPPAIAAGEYEIEIELAIGDDSGGDEFEVLLAGQVVRGKVPEFADGDDRGAFQKVVVGRVSISNAGREVIYLRPSLLKGKVLMELKALRLKPVKE